MRINGQRASFIPILKNSTASTLAVVDAVKAMLPDIQDSAPSGIDLKMDFDQSVFVRAAVAERHQGSDGVVDRWSR